MDGMDVVDKMYTIYRVNLLLVHVVHTVHVVHHFEKRLMPLTTELRPDLIHQEPPPTSLAHRNP